MANRAQVNSVESIDAFRTRLILYMTKARACVEEASSEVQRTQSWLEHTQRAHWEKEVRRRSRNLEEAEQELFSARLSSFRTWSAAQLQAVERAKRALQEAQEKREAVRRWTREFENRAEPLAKHVEQLQTFIGTDLVKAVAHLESVVTILQSYADQKTGTALGASPPAGLQQPAQAGPPANPPEPSESS